MDIINIDDYIKRNSITPAMLGRELEINYITQALYRWRKNLPEGINKKLHHLEAIGYWKREDVRRREAERIKRETEKRVISAKHARECATREDLARGGKRGSASRWGKKPR